MTHDITVPLRNLLSNQLQIKNMASKTKTQTHSLRPVALCANCGLETGDGACIASWIDGTEKVFCDHSCMYQSDRERTRPFMERDIKKHQTWLKKPIPVFARRFIGCEILYFRACIARKPRAEIERIRQEYKKSLVDLVEFAHENKQDGVAFMAGDLFREDDDELIDAWSAP